MTEIKRTTRFFLLITAIEIAVFALAFAIGASEADAHARPINPSACELVWKQSPPGHRWAAKQRCLAYVTAHNCTVIPRFVPKHVTVKGVRVDSNQRHVLSWVVTEALRRHLSRTYALAAIQATTQEATAWELDHGEGTSVGPFQLTSDHGPRALRITVEYSGNWFYDGAGKVYRRGMTPAQLAQAVERSGHPTAYSQHSSEARRSLRIILGPCRLR